MRPVPILYEYIYEGGTPQVNQEGAICPLNDEDYNKWEKEMKVALKSNCDRRDDQIRKIREYLKNHPLSLVPENLDNVDAAFSTPKSLYGDPSHMMKRKKDKLLSLGQYPKPAWFQSSVSH